MTENNHESATAATRAADVTSPGEPLTEGEEASSSSSFDPAGDEAEGTATGNPLAGTGTPKDGPVYPEGSERS